MKKNIHSGDGDGWAGVARDHFPLRTHLYLHRLAHSLHAYTARCTLFSETTSVWNWPDRGSRWIHRIHLAEEARLAPTCYTRASTLALVTPRIVGFYSSTCYASLFTLDFPSLSIIFPGKIKPAIRSSTPPLSSDKHIWVKQDGAWEILHMCCWWMHTASVDNMRQEIPFRLLQQGRLGTWVYSDIW